MKLDELFAQKRGVCMTHVYYGDPSEEFSVKAIKALCKAGADIIEFGIPFSDPVADGPVFQRACERALKAGMTPKKAIEGIRRLRHEGIEQPLVVTTYCNIVFRMGVEEFVKAIGKAGADALIVPDVPFEEADALLESGERNGVKIILIVTPTTPDMRLAEILKRAQGFVYVAAVAGVTGARDDVSQSTLDLIKRVHAISQIPLLVGFGISKPEHAKAIMAAGADGVIIGSAIGGIYERKLEKPEDSLSEIQEFIKRIQKGCNDVISGGRKSNASF